MYPRIKELRTDKDITQENISKYLHCSQRTYSDYERGVVPIPLTMLSQLADLYGTSIDYMVGRTDEKTPYKPSKRII